MKVQCSAHHVNYFVGLTAHRFVVITERQRIVNKYAQVMYLVSEVGWLSID